MIDVSTALEMREHWDGGSTIEEVEEGREGDLEAAKLSFAVAVPVLPSYRRVEVVK